MNLSSNNQKIISAIEDAQNFLDPSIYEEPKDCISTLALTNATNFLLFYTIKLEELGKEMPVPDIGPAGENSVDLFWEIGDKTLLINFKSSGLTGTFAGLIKDVTDITGELHLFGDEIWIFKWLID